MSKDERHVVVRDGGQLCGSARDVVRTDVVRVSSWTLALPATHHSVRHLTQLTELARQGAAKAVVVQILGWVGRGRGQTGQTDRV